MRTKSVDELLDAQQNSVKLNLNKLFENFLPFAPMIEATGVIPDQPIYSMGRGMYNLYVSMCVDTDVLY